MSAETTKAIEDPLIRRVVCGCEIIALVSQGGMGRLYQARQLSLDRIVAVKVLSPELVANHEFLARFRREAKALANLVHPNIVAVHDFGHEGDIHAIVMEYVEGESVADILAQTNIIPPLRAVNIIRQVAEGLECAHQCGIIHCDLKPENILITPEGVAKVVDFGLAKSLRGNAMRVTQEGTILGTPTYMSPEQCEGGPLDGRSDIYSLGATFYRMVAGRDAFEGENAFAIMLKHQKEPPPDPRQFNSDLPREVARVILRMMEKDPARRYQSASEVVGALRAIEEGVEPRTKITEEVEHPRREFIIAREAVEAGIITPDQLRAFIAQRDRTGQLDSDIPSRLVHEGLLTPEQLEEVARRARTREEASANEQFAALVVQAGMATKEQIEACLERQRRTAETKLSRVMVEEGVLETRQVVQLLMRQLKKAQEREDAELLELLRRDNLVSQADLERCIREQRRQEAAGHPRVLRQVIVELGILPPARLRTILRRKAYEDLEAYLVERERAELAATGPILPDEEELKLDDSRPCPHCGQPVPDGAARCPACQHPLASRRARPGPARRQAPPRQAPARPAKAQKAEWEIRLPDGQPSRPLTFAALVRLAREKRLKPRTVLRGPLTRGIWRQARHTPRLCRLFATCHYCEARLPANARACPECGTDPDKPPEI